MEASRADNRVADARNIIAQAGILALALHEHGPRIAPLSLLPTADALTLTSVYSLKRTHDCVFSEPFIFGLGRRIRQSLRKIDVQTVRPPSRFLTC